MSSTKLPVGSAGTNRPSTDLREEVWKRVAASSVLDVAPTKGSPSRGPKRPEDPSGKKGATQTQALATSESTEA